MKLEKNKAEILRQAVENQYWTLFYIDELPVWGVVGEVIQLDEPMLLIYTHKKFQISYNNDQIIEINYTNTEPVPIEDEMILSFKYSISWTSTKINFSSRFKRYLEPEFFEGSVHWFSLLNSFLLVLFLLGIVTFILLRVTSSDIARIQKKEQEIEKGELGFAEETGWKRVANEVFRSPPQLMILTAFISSGHHLIFVIFGAIILCLAEEFYEVPGSFTTMFFVVWAFLGLVGGFSSGRFYKQNDGKKWIQTMILSALLIPAVISVVMLKLDLLAAIYHSANQIHFIHLMLIFVTVLFIYMPMYAFGTILGRNVIKVEPPAKSNLVRQPVIKLKPWYAQPIILSLCSGGLTFLAIYTETYYVFQSFYNYKFYYVYGFALAVFWMLLICSACVSIVSTYILLNSEDYRWHWLSFCSSATTGGFVYLYAFYFFAHTKMHGLYQFMFYFGYAGIFSTIIALVSGAIGYTASSMFVWTIYSRIKND